MNQPASSRNAITLVRALVIVFWVGLLSWLWITRPGPILPAVIPAGETSSGQPVYWFKGNTHAHARMTYKGWTHGDSSPEKVVRWYRDHGYHFAALTDHNRWTDSSTLPAEARGNEIFLLLAGMEVTSDYRYPGTLQEGQRKIHSTALNTAREVDWSFDNANKASIIRTQFQRIHATGGLAILNHPNYDFQLELNDIVEAGDIRLVEFFNAHPRSNQAGHAGFRPPVDALWDNLLSSGQRVYGLASDDAHDFSWYGKALRRFGTAPPGGAWIMVKAARLQAADLLAAIESGEFYASTGVYLKQVSAEHAYYEVELDMERTRAETRHSWVRDAAPVVWSDDSHFVIEFFGANGRLLHSVHDQVKAGIPITAENTYVRSRITYLEKLPSLTGADWARAYHAWTQPVFADPPESTN